MAAHAAEKQSTNGPNGADLEGSYGNGAALGRQLCVAIRRRDGTDACSSIQLTSEQFEKLYLQRA